MVNSIVVDTHIGESTDAGTALGAKVTKAFGGESPDVLLVFSSVGYDHQALLGAALAACKPKLLLGGSSSGGFTRAAYGDGMACAIAIRDPQRNSAGPWRAGWGGPRGRGPHAGVGVRGPRRR